MTGVKSVGASQPIPTDKPTPQAVSRPGFFGRMVNLIAQVLPNLAQSNPRKDSFTETDAIAILKDFDRADNYFNNTNSNDSHQNEEKRDYTLTSAPGDEHKEREYINNNFQNNEEKETKLKISKITKNKLTGSIKIEKQRTNSQIGADNEITLLIGGPERSLDDKKLNKNGQRLKYVNTLNDINNMMNHKKCIYESSKDEEVNKHNKIKVKKKKKIRIRKRKSVTEMKAASSGEISQLQHTQKRTHSQNVEKRNTNTKNTLTD